nr:HAD hydrolase-like protein [Yimella sp. cx-51]
MVFSNEVEWAKPDRRIFEISLTFVQGTAAEPFASSCVVHIGDNPVADVEGARAAGLSAVLVEPDGESTVAALEALR